MRSMGPTKIKLAISAVGRDDSGAAMVEFAVSLAVLIPLVIGTIDLGLAMYHWSQVNDMAESGALYATTNAQQLYSGPLGGGPFDPSGIISAASNAGPQLAATTSVVGVCSCLPTIPTSCPSTTQFANSNASNPYCYSGGCSTPASDPGESAYVCVKTSYTHNPIITFPFIPAVTLTAISMVKIH